MGFTSPYGAIIMEIERKAIKPGPKPWDPVYVPPPRQLRAGWVVFWVLAFCAMAWMVLIVAVAFSITRT
jgi:hypothetical protein